MKTKEEIIESLERQLESMRDFDTDMNAASWGYEEGVLLTGNEAEFILNILKHES